MLSHYVTPHVDAQEMDSNKSTKLNNIVPFYFFFNIHSIQWHSQNDTYLDLIHESFECLSNKLSTIEANLIH